MARQDCCRGCGQPLPSPFLDLGSMPLANSYIDPERAAEVEPRYPLAVSYCGSCHLVQLTYTVPPAEMFSEYLYFSSYSDTFLEHARRMAEDLTRDLELGPKSLVLEVASNDGYLLQYFQRAGIRVLGVEPARNIAREAEKRGIPTLNRFFGPDLVREIVVEHGRADLLVGCNVLAHIPDVIPFLVAVRDCLGPDGVAVFEFPWVGALLEHVEFDTIYHEHVFYYSLAAVKGLAERAGLEVERVEHQPVHGQSLRVMLQQPGRRPTTASVAEWLAHEGSLGLTGRARYDAFSEQVRALREELVGLLTGLRAAGERVAAYGAPAKGNTLLNYCGIGTDVLEFTVDRSPHKQGHMLPGTRIPILAPEALLAEMPGYAVILAWNLADEIIASNAEYLRRGGRFIIPVPRPREVAVP